MPAACFFAFATSVQASHLAGADLQYTHVSGSTYKITVVLYGDCGPASAGAFSTLPSATPRVCIYNGSTLVTTLVLSVDTPSAGVEVTYPLAAGVTTQCTDPSSTRRGIKKFTYSANYTVPSASSTWRFIFNGNHGSASSGRAAANTNVSSSTTIQLIDTLDNTTYNNSSPAMNVTSPTYYCKDVVNTFYPTATDPDGDSLSFSLVDATNGTGSCGTVGGPVAYSSGFSAWPGQPVSGATPLQVAAGTFSVNAFTGAMSFLANSIQRAVAVYNLREYRSGVLVGTSQREMTVLVLTCAATTGVAQASEPRIELYPNPVTGELTISHPGGTYNSFVIVNALGAKMLDKQLQSANTTTNVSALPAGIYFITLSGESGTKTLKFIKQ
ncbi:MAG: T9SS type A sorting domain-containing protein [Bacteroidota bacterium]